MKSSDEVESSRPKFEEILPGTYLLKVPFGPVWTGIVLIKGGEGAAPTRERGGGGAASTHGRGGEGAASTRERGGEGAAPTRERGGEGAAPTVLIDSSHLEPEECLIPALAELGIKISDIDWLLNTHVHGDHIGGHHALVTKYGLKVACLESSADALRDPVKVAIRVRTRFPRNSPPPQSYLKGVEPSVLLKEGELLAGRFYAIATPGHDDDCVTWIDNVTHTAFTGDSLQANGTPTQGIGFYRDLDAYRLSLAKLRSLGGEGAASTHGRGGDGAAPTHGRGGEGAASTQERGGDGAASTQERGGFIENIVCGHEYDGIGSVVLGRDAVVTALQCCTDRIDLYGHRLAAYVGRGAPALTMSEDDITRLAIRLIDDVGCGRPSSLFLAMHTVEQHLEEL